MSYTSQDLANISAAISAGTLTVEYQGRRVTYRSIDDLLRVKKLMEEELFETDNQRTTRAYRMRG